jgi:antitoxin component YwqK of YwqJK toxin-antitoxin module
MRALCPAVLLAGLAACNRTEVHGDGDAKYVVRYFPNRIRKEEGFERNGKRAGIWTLYFDDTGNRCCQNVYVNDVLDGLTVRWHENGEVREEGQFKNGEACGTWVNWFESGIKHMERVFEHDKANGPATSWFENGQTSSTGSFLQNLPEGEWSQWYESGQLRSAGFYNKGKKQGRWNFFTETGEVDKDLTGVYVDDELVEPPPGK